MSTCLNHPDVPTRRRCALCRQAFCHGCLEEYEPVGPVCAECETVLEQVPANGLLERLPALREEVRRTLPPERHWWGWELLYWGGVALPGLLAALYLLQVFQVQHALAVLSHEPLLPGQTVARLTDVAAALERYHATHGDYPASLESLRPPDLPGADRTIDLYGWKKEPLLYLAAEGRFRLCSRGPDRVDDRGAPLDRFTARGDLCVGGMP
jgi:hypothetical protein